MENADEITYFERLEDEQEEQTPVATAGVLGGLFGRWFKGSEGDVPPQMPTSSASNSQSEELQLDTETPSDEPNLVQNPQPPSPGSISRVSSNDDGTPRRKTTRLSALFRKERPGLQDYNRSSFRQYWMPDSTGKECYQCEEKFTAFRRRHHCRLCGQIFCAKCCNVHVNGAPLGYIGDLRLCTYCARMVNQHHQGDERNSSEDISGPQPVILQSISEQGPTIAASPEQTNGFSAIATVSAGSLLWSRDQPDSNGRKNSLSLPPPSYKPPTMLCVQDLFMSQNSSDHPASIHSTAGSCSALTVDEEESGPDWVRNMDLMGHGQYDALHAMDATRSQPSTSVHFDVGPLTVDSNETLQEQKDLRKDSLAQRKSLSPTESLKERLVNEDDVEKLFDRRADMLLEYLFHRQNIDKTRWKDIVMRTAQEVASTVKVDVYQKADKMNILNYVHIKTLVVDDDIANSETIWGVLCSKSVTHSSMSGELHNASVMIVAGSIEYERIPGKLSNLEPIINQETEFLAKQVDRILSKRPSLLLVEQSVSRVAAELLRAAGVRLVIGVKKEVLARVSRATGADVLPSSDAQLVNQSIGFCPLFSQRVEKTVNGQNKLILVFDHCPPERGCSVLLKSNCRREVREVKKILKFMILTLYSANLEKAYLALYNCQLAYQISSCDACETRREFIELEEENEDSFLGALHKSVLSASPYIEFEPPFLETPKGKQCSLLPYFKQPLYRYGTREDFESKSCEEVAFEKQKDSGMSTVPALPRHPFSLVGKSVIVEEQSASSFRALSGGLFKIRVKKRSSEQKQKTEPSESPARREDVLDPYVHQRVAILFGSFSPKSPNAPLLCVRPWVVSMQFYAENDMPLGEFLTKFCFNKEYQCPSSNCELSMMDHSRKMVFGRVCVEVTTTVVSSSGPSESQQASPQGISTYHYCEICKASSPIVYMDFKTWHLSFAKFLDYIANSSFSQGSICSPNEQPCHHCFFHQQSHFFSFNNYATCFRVTTIRPYHVQFSPVICKIQPTAVSGKSLTDMVTRIADFADLMCNTASDHLTAFMQHEQCTQYAGTFHTVLRQVVEKTRQAVADLVNDAQEIVHLEEGTVQSTSDLHVKANETFMHIRDAIYQLISTWNEQGQVLGASLRAMKKNVEEGSSTAENMEITLDRLDDPFPNYLHLSLKLHLKVGVIVRDIENGNVQDGKREYKPDIGSIIAYALSSSDYDEGRTKSREAMGDGDVPLNLSSASVPDENAARSEHVEIEFQDSQASYYVKAYYAERFRLLRKLLFPAGEEAFIRSLAKSTFWTPQGGKSGAFFYRTEDHRFVIKQMSKFEVQSFVKFAPRYFEYIKTAVTESKLTTLCKVYGVFRVGYKSKSTGAQVKTDILVMEYLFYKHNVKQVWDLKGSLRNRMASTGKSSSDLVLMDENFMKDLWNNQLYVYPHSKAALNQAISNDSHFLSAQHVMDYSLLVGVDETNGDLVLGIVDYMRTYTLDKKLESWVKIVAIPGAHLPTVISPEMYCTRFSEAIDTYFPVVPDQWTGLGSTVSY